MSLTDFQNFAVISICGLVLYLTLKLKLHPLIFSFFLFAATFVGFFGHQFRMFAGYRFLFWWTIIAFEHFFPRNRYDFFSFENMRNGSMYPIRWLSIDLASALFPLLFTNWHSLSLNLKESSIPAWIQVCGLLLISDLWMYWIHRFQHQNDVYWKFHRIHHSTTELSFWAGGRTNIFEYVLMQHLPILMMFHFSGSSSNVKWITFLVHVTIGIPSHANINFPPKKLSWLNYIWVTPNFHAVHHSLLGQRSNYAQDFPFWDLVFGTFKMPEEKISVFGIDDTKYNDRTLTQQTLDAFLPDSISK